MNLIVRQPYFLKSSKQLSGYMISWINVKLSNFKLRVEKPIKGLMYDYLFRFCTDVFYAGYDL